MLEREPDAGDPAFDQVPRLRTTVKLARLRELTVIKAWQVLFRVGSVARLAYGLGSVLAPEWMAERYAPSPEDHADPRMNLRGFGGAHTAIALYSLAMATSVPRARTALGLNALVDALDAYTTLLERRDRGRFDRVVAGGLVLNLAALLCWTGAARGLSREAGTPADRAYRPLTVARNANTQIAATMNAITGTVAPITPATASAAPTTPTVVAVPPAITRR
jgi:hypothetical protein